MDANGWCQVKDLPPNARCSKCGTANTDDMGMVGDVPMCFDCYQGKGEAMASVKRYHIPGFSINESERFVLASDYERLESVVRDLMEDVTWTGQMGINHNAHITVPASVANRALALIGEDGEEGK